MRKITHVSGVHNASGAFGTLRAGIVLMTALLGLGACSPQADDQATGAAKNSPTDASCALTMDTSGWDAFLELADTIAAGTEVTGKELDAFGELPAVTLWRNSLAPDTPTAMRVGNWLEGTFWDQLGRQGEQKINADRAFFIRSYRYSLTNRQDITEKLAILTGPRQCEIREKADFWIEPGHLPENVTIYFMPAKSEIRIFEGSLVVDTGVLSAGSVGQIIRQATSLLYRKYQFAAGGNPIELEGAEAVGHSFRVLMNEGMTGWIEQAHAMEFNKDHPELHKVRIIPEEFFKKTVQTIDLMNTKLGPMLDDEAEMSAKGLAFARHLAGMNGFTPTGLGMATAIAEHLGEERLRNAGRSVPDFLAAFQEAALRNPVPAPEPGDLGVELYLTVPPLETGIYTRLHAMLTDMFPG